MSKWGTRPDPHRPSYHSRIYGTPRQFSSQQKKPRRRKKPRGGGQPGHQRQLREPLPPDRVDQTVKCEIDEGEVEWFGLTPTGDLEIVQHIELPETPVHVTEYRLAVYRDADGQLYLPDSPESA